MTKLTKTWEEYAQPIKTDEEYYAAVKIAEGRNWGIPRHTGSAKLNALITAIIRYQKKRWGFEEDVYAKPPT